MSKRRQKQEVTSPENGEVRDQSYRRTIYSRNEKQKEYIQTMQSHDVVFGVGSAGTGKTYLAVAEATRLYDANRIERIILVRPVVATEDIGFLPGELKDKLDPYMRPLYDALFDRWAPKIVTGRIERGEIEIAPLAFMRGRTFNNCVLILDEAQNTDIEQMRMFLTRLGENVKVFITGDPHQSDLRGDNGLVWAVNKLNTCPTVGIVRFEREDIVRSELMKQLIKYLY